MAGGGAHRPNRIRFHGWEFDSQSSVSLAIRQTFDLDQPNHFGTADATIAPLQLGGFHGTVERGGCAVSEVRLIPHCNGTHTESVQHIVADPFLVADHIPPLQIAIVISVETTAAEKTPDTYRPAFQPGDRVVSADAIRRASEKAFAANKNSSRDASPVTALIVRTMPNAPDKKQRKWAEGTGTAFFTVEAIEAVCELQIEHLLVDLPSIDRAHDEGLLTCHHQFWGVPEGQHHLAEESHPQRSITEMIYVPDTVADGLVLLNLQVPDWQTDAVPSRPIIWRPAEDFRFEGNDR